MKLKFFFFFFIVNVSSGAEAEFIDLTRVVAGVKLGVLKGNMFDFF